MVTDEAGRIIAEFSYGTYGELIEAEYNPKTIKLSDATAESKDSLTETTTEYGNPTIRFLYNGQLGVTTDENGLYYMRSRYYNPGLKRFINQDILTGSVGNNSSLNRYSYVEGNPVSYTDPFGLSPYANNLFAGLVAGVSLLSMINPSQMLHAVFDVLGFLPGLFGSAFDLANVVLYSIEGNTEEAVKSFIFMLPGLDMMGAAEKYAAKGGKYVEQYTSVMKFFTGLGNIGSMVLSANGLGDSIAGMIDKYLVDGEKITMAFGFEVMFAALYGWSTFTFAGLTIKLPEQLQNKGWEDILEMAKKGSDSPTAKDTATAKDTSPAKDAETIKSEDMTGKKGEDADNISPKEPDTIKPSDTPKTPDSYKIPDVPEPAKPADPVNPGKASNDGGCYPPGSGCFTAGTLIRTKSGYKAIEEIEAGDYVYAKNPDTGEEDYRLVARTVEYEVTELVHIRIGDICIDATMNHPIWVDGYGFIPADELRVGDVVETASGEKKQITSVETECYDEPVTVYNFEVMDWHTYFVSELEVLVHNADCNNSAHVTIVKETNSYTDYRNNAGQTIRIPKQSTKSIDSAIASKHNSKEVGTRVEAKVADYIRNDMGMELTDFGNKVKDSTGQTIGDIDCATKDVLIEVKSSIGSVKTDQFAKYVDSSNIKYINIYNKKVILYVEEPMINLSSSNAQKIIELKAKGVIIVNNLDELKGVLQ